jgi:hypothetical protein
MARCEFAHPCGCEPRLPETPAPVQATRAGIQTALLHVLFATQDLYNDDHSARYERWRNWAISWLREVTNGAY